MIWRGGRDRDGYAWREHGRANVYVPSPERAVDRPADGVGSGVVRWYIGNKNNILNDILVDAHDVIITYL